MGLWATLTLCRGMATSARKVVMGRAFRGLYDGKHIQFGNQISFSGKKSRRSWKPNVQSKRFWSETKQRLLHFRMTTSVIRKVKLLAGGIDEYLMMTPDSQLLYKKAISIKRNLLRHHRRSAEALEHGNFKEALPSAPPAPTA